MKRGAALLLGFSTAGLAIAAQAPIPPRFSASPPGNALPAGWKPYAMSRHKPAAPATLVDDAGTTVLRIATDKNAGAAAYALNLSATELDWRWKVDHVVAAADLGHKGGDDAAARVYVFFDVPRSALSFGERMKLRLASHLLGEELPRAALCYVWDNRHAVGTIMSSAFYGKIRTIVLESGNARAGEWRSERRDLSADFRAAFGKEAPAVTGVAVAVDSDNTGGQASAWFGDLVLSPGTE